VWPLRTAEEEEEEEEKNRIGKVRTLKARTR
jgi:hypothetical protein